MAITMEEKTKKQQVNEAMQVDSAQNKTTRYADIREWNPEHNKMSRGIGMNKSEIAVLLEALSA